MKRKKLTVAAAAILLLFHSCSMLSPSYISFENGSAYPVTIYLEENGGEPLELEPGKKGFRLLTPGENRVRVEIEELGFSRDYALQISYLQKSRFIFRADS